MMRVRLNRATDRSSNHQQDASLKDEHTNWSLGTTATQHTPSGHLPSSPRRRLQEGNDARTPPPPNPQIWGFHPGNGEAETGIGLSVASKEGNGIQDVTNAVTDTVGQGFLPA